MKRWMLAVMAVVALGSMAMGSMLTGFAFAQDAGPTAAPTAPVAAPTPPDPEAGGFGFMKTILDAVMSKNWTWAAVLVLIAMVWGLRKFGGKKFKWLKTDRGGAVLVMGTSVLGAVATAIGAGKGLSKDVVLQAVYVGFMGAGGWVWVRRMMGQKNPEPPSENRKETVQPT